MQIVNNMVVYGGIDPKFNAKRVFPPSEIEYPDLLRDRDFFTKIGCPHLAIKYPQQSLDREPKTEVLSPLKMMLSAAVT